MKEFRKLSPCAVPMGSRRAKTVCISRSLGRTRLRCGSGSARDRRLLHSAGCGKEHGQREKNGRNLLHTYRLLVYQDAGNMGWVSQKTWGNARNLAHFPTREVRTRLSEVNPACFSARSGDFPGFRRRGWGAMRQAPRAGDPTT